MEEEEKFTYRCEVDPKNENLVTVICTSGKYKGRKVTFYTVSPSLAYFNYYKRKEDKD